MSAIEAIQREIDNWEPDADDFEFGYVCGLEAALRAVLADQNTIS